MTAPATAVLDGHALWYLSRGAGAVALLLLTTSVVLGVADVRRWSTPRVPRFVVDSVHRTVSLLVVVILAIHIATTVLDPFAPIRLLDAVLPFGSAYRPLWLGFGALAFDLLVALVVTSLVRARLGYARWRAVHWLAYACWPIALVHGLGTGSDVRSGFMLPLSVGCALAVAAAVVVRLGAGRWKAPAWRLGGLAAVLAAGAALALWLPSGPLARGWAARAGTPKAVLPATRAAAAATATLPRSAPVRGRLHQLVRADGSAVDRLTLAVQRGAASRLVVTLAGRALPTGGIAFDQGTATLGVNGSPTRYHGPVTALQGDRLSATLTAAGAPRVDLAATLRVDHTTGAISGTADFARSAGGRMTQPRLLAGLVSDAPVTLEQHRSVHGDLPELAGRDEGARLLSDVEAAGLRGRGGAAFPTAVKAAATAAGRRPIVVANGSRASR